MRITRMEMRLITEGLQALIKNYTEAYKLIVPEYPTERADIGSIRIEQRLQADVEKAKRLLEKISKHANREGVTEITNGKQQEVGNMELFYALIENKYKQVNGLGFVLELTNKTQREIANILGIKHQNVYKWVAGVQAVSKRHLPKLENILGVPKEYLVKELSVEDKVEILKMFYNKDKEISF